MCAKWKNKRFCLIIIIITLAYSLYLKRNLLTLIDGNEIIQLFYVYFLSHTDIKYDAHSVYIQAPMLLLSSLLMINIFYLLIWVSVVVVVVVDYSMFGKMTEIKNFHTKPASIENKKYHFFPPLKMLSCWQCI